MESFTQFSKYESTLKVSEPVFRFRYFGLISVNSTGVNDTIMRLLEWKAFGNRRKGGSCSRWKDRVKENLEIISEKIVEKLKRIERDGEEK